MADWPAATVIEVGVKTGAGVPVGWSESISNWNVLERAVAFWTVMDAMPGWARSFEDRTAVSWVGERKCVGRGELFK